MGRPPDRRSRRQGGSASGAGPIAWPHQGSLRADAAAAATAPRRPAAALAGRAWTGFGRRRKTPGGAAREPAPAAPVRRPLRRPGRRAPRREEPAFGIAVAGPKPIQGSNRAESPSFRRARSHSSMKLSLVRRTARVKIYFCKREYRGPFDDRGALIGRPRRRGAATVPTRGRSAGIRGPDADSTPCDPTRFLRLRAPSTARSAHGPRESRRAGRIPGSRAARRISAPGS